MLMEPPTFTQVPLPSTLTNPTPYSAQELLRTAPLRGSTLPEGGSLAGFCCPVCCANASAGQPATMMKRKGFIIPPFTARRRIRLAHELDAEGLAAVPDHFAISSGPGIARERQPQLRGQRVVIVDDDLRTRRREVLHH